MKELLKQKEMIEKLEAEIKAINEVNAELLAEIEEIEQSIKSKELLLDTLELEESNN